MKMQLTEQELNVYINAALNEEIDELLGSRTRKQSRRMITGQGWGNQRRADNSDIRATDADEECPQTLVGMVSKMEQMLVGLEQFAGFNSTSQNLAAGIEQRGSLGRFKMKKSLIAAIEALTQISERLKTLENTVGANQLMEGANEITDPLGATGWASQGIDATVDSVITPGTGTGAAAAGTKGGFWSGLGKGLKSIGKGIGGAAKWTVTPLKAGATGVGGALTTPLAIASAAFAIAQAATVAATKGRQRKIVRTYNCASILAKRIGMVAQTMGQQQGQTQQEKLEENINEINVRKGKKSFASIEQGMNQLSAIMKEIYAQMNGQGQDQMPQSLNTREQIKQFQNWANAHGYRDQSGQPLEPDGIFGRRTAYVYDQIAASSGNRAPRMDENKAINESKAVERALQNLEYSVGRTGTGAAAYSDVSRLSGGQNASRLQNAQNIKEIIRTYPPVLNQYQKILQRVGADVSGLQLLTVDQRPHRDYSIKELKAIDKRIQELLYVAQNLDGIKPVSENVPVNLPPKPVVRTGGNPGRKPSTKPEPEKKPAKAIDEPLPSVDKSKMNLPTGATSTAATASPATLTPPQGRLAGTPPQPTLAQNAASQMVRTATANPSDASQQEKNAALRQQRDNALNTIRSDSYAGDKKVDSKFVRDAYRNIKRGNNHPTLQENKLNLSEKELQAYINEAIKREIKI